MPIRNPILAGSYPDPALIRVGETYVLANSTFDWWPAVSLHTSTDLANWTPVPSPIRRADQLDLRGVASSFGVWAPDISYAHGLYWLVVTNVKSVHASFTDCANYLFTCPTLDGDWDGPYPLDGVGFDARLFHDTDGRDYLVQQTCDFREDRPPFAGVTLTELDRATMRLKPRTQRIIWAGSSAGSVEGPHLYHINGWYYLVCAEGGTGWEHRVSVARSRTLDAGSFEESPHNPLITSVDDPTLPLQKQGHASFVDTPDGDWYMAYLCARPWRAADDAPDCRGWCTLGRETALQRLEWTDDGWPLVVGGPHGRLEIEAPHEPVTQIANHAVHDDFTSPRLDSAWKTPRVPFERMGTTGDGALTLTGQGSPCDAFDLSLVARRWTDHAFDAAVTVAFDPWNFQQMAGLTNYYGSTLWSWAYVTWDDRRACPTLEVCENADDHTTTFLRGSVPVPAGTRSVRLRTRVRTSTYTYDYAFDDGDWQGTGVWLDARTLSDDYAWQHGRGFFTGAFVGMCAVDMSGFGAQARFTDFDYDPAVGATDDGKDPV
ncbi:MAG: glycoside hydrolase family 43 protein [Bifidobacterium sp.]|nr:glycoside hydrolase family 43 protein [Bifidobacterium sp.]